MAKKNLFDLGYTCLYCEKPIEDKLIPPQIINKLERFTVWHEECKRD